MFSLALGDSTPLSSAEFKRQVALQKQKQQQLQQQQQQQNDGDLTGMHQPVTNQDGAENNNNNNNLTSTTSQKQKSASSPSPHSTATYGRSNMMMGGLSSTQQNKDNNKGPTLPRAIRAKALVYRGNTYRELGALNESIEDLKKAVELEQESAANHNILGLSYFEQGDYKNAVTVFAKAVEIDGTNAVYFNNLGLAHFQQGKYPDNTRSQVDPVEVISEY